MSGTGSPASDRSPERRDHDGDDGRDDGRDGEDVGGPTGDGKRPGETEGERLDRNYGELLQELRVTQTGTQILFAFLLTIAFSRPFMDASDLTHQVYAVTLVMCAVATGLLIAPVAIHRIVFRKGLKRELVSLSNKLALAGVYVLSLAVTGSLFIALDTVMPRTLAVVVSASVAALVIGLWLVLPLVVRGQYERWGGDRQT